MRASSRLVMAIRRTWQWANRGNPRFEPITFHHEEKNVMTNQPASRFLGLILFLLFGVCEANAAKPRPNVLFLAVDDMNDWVGCLETTPRALTPNIDRLAARGVNFSNAHTAGVFCAPSRAAIFSGQYASTTGCYETPYYFVGHPEIEGLQIELRQSWLHDAGGRQTISSPGRRHRPARLDQVLPSQSVSAHQRLAARILEQGNSCSPAVPSKYLQPRPKDSKPGFFLNGRLFPTREKRRWLTRSERTGRSIN